MGRKMTAEEVTVELERSREEVLILRQRIDEVEASARRTEERCRSLIASMEGRVFELERAAEAEADYRLEQSERL